VNPGQTFIFLNTLHSLCSYFVRKTEEQLLHLFTAQTHVVSLKTSVNNLPFSIMPSIVISCCTHHKWFSTQQQDKQFDPSAEMADSV
ncbi:MAG: hypothetical protein ACRC28_10995, partial [Clostridium sp.]|uniref:hypothetical protein n=1 Tax=Clostridium sp. TaxID=1506 RepID=UPI003F2B0039